MIYKLLVECVLDVPNDADIEEVCGSFESGLPNALAHFPLAEVFEATIESVEQASAADIAERGWEE